MKNCLRVGDNVDHVQVCINATIITEAQVLVIGWDILQEIIANKLVEVLETRG